MTSDDIIKIIDELCKKFGVAIDWTAQNIMPYLQEVFGRLIKYKLITNSIGLATSIILIIAVIIMLIKTITAYISADKADNINWACDGYGPSFFVMILWVILAAALIVCICTTCKCISSLIGWAIVPEVELFKMLQDANAIG